MGVVTRALDKIAGWIIKAVEWLLGGRIPPEPGEPPSVEEYEAEIHEMTDTEKQMMEETSQCINNQFNNSLVGSIMSMDADSRMEASNKLIAALSALYGITLNGVEYFLSDSGNMGCYSRKDNVISLNAAYLLCDQEEAILAYIDTIIHELRHAVQWAIIEGKMDWGISEEKQKEWAKNFNNYISPRRSRKLYYAQPVEFDAFTFAYGSMKGVIK